MKINNTIRNSVYKYAYLFSALSICASLVLAFKQRVVKSDMFFFTALFLSALGTCLFLFDRSNKPSKVNIYQMTAIWGVFALFWNVSMITLMYYSQQLNYLMMIFGAVIINFNFCAYLSALLFSSTNCVQFNIKPHVPYLILCALFIIGNINTLDLWFKSDSNYYYTDIVSNAYKWTFSLNSISSLSIAGHSMYGYSIFAYIGQYLIPAGGIGIRLVNIILSCITIICFYKLIKKLRPSLTTVQLFLISACFAGGAWFLGLSQEISSDFPLLCFFVWFVYCYMRGYTILKVATGILVCFSKENGILLIGAFVIGAALHNFIVNSDKNRSLKYRLFHSIYANDWFLLIAALLFGINMLFNKEGWSAEITNVVKEPGSDRSIYLRWDYIIVKLKEMFAMNFVWVVVGICIILLIICIIKKVKFSFNLSCTAVALLFSYMALLIFNLIYFTFPHYRYVQLNMFFAFVFLAFLVSKVPIGKLIKNVILSFLSFLLILQSYFTIDPVTLRLFRNINVGKGRIVTTTTYGALPDHGIVLFGENEGIPLDDHIFGDVVQYNRSYTDFEHVFEKLLAEIKYDSTKAICIPPIFQSINYTIQSLFGRVDQNTCYWNSFKNQMTYDSTDIKINWIDAEQLSKNDFQTFSEIWFIKFPYDDRWDYDNFFKKVKVEEEITVSYGDWELELYKITYSSFKGK